MIKHFNTKSSEQTMRLVHDIVRQKPSRSTTWEHWMPRRLQRDKAEGKMLLGVHLVDSAIIAASFFIAFWLRYHSDLLLPAEPEAAVVHYHNLILLGIAMNYLVWITHSKYELRTLLHPCKKLGRFLFLTGSAMFVLIGFSLVFRTTPAISRMYVVFTWLIMGTGFGIWRLMLARHLKNTEFATTLRRRLLLIGSGPETATIARELTDHPLLELAGWVEGVRGPNTESQQLKCLGNLGELDAIFRRHDIDTAVLLEAEDLLATEISQIQQVCEREHVQFKLTPRFFEVMISGLRPSFIAGVPVLGVEQLPLHSFTSRLLKRSVDIVGAIVGLTIALPVMTVLGVLVYIESPGSIFYRQIRTGINGQNFAMYKIRSMRLDAEAGGKAQWAVENDKRRLAIGAFMRRWNLDELPQFWNVLTGDMSLVGPRPERPELIEEFKYTVPHYQSRHACRPGMSGWAQVNGLRGNTSLEERIRFDIWYVENWNLLLDFRIMFLTFCRQNNAY